MAGRGVLVLCYAATGRVYSLARSTFQKGELGCGSEKFAGWGRVRPAGLQGFDGWRWTRVRAIPEKRRRRTGITRPHSGPIRAPTVRQPASACNSAPHQAIRLRSPPSAAAEKSGVKPPHSKLLCVSLRLQRAAEISTTEDAEVRRGMVCGLLPSGSSRLRVLVLV